jgi:TrmH family RNA methyltransferase
MIRRATSRQNPRLREAATLIASARDRRKAGKCVLEGEHVVAAYLARHGPADTLIICDDALARPAVRALAVAHATRTLVVAPALFADLAALPAGIGLLAVVAAPKPSDAASADFCLLLEDVQDPGNVGSMLRSAAAAGVGQVLLSKHCAFAWSPKVLRAGQGAQFQVDVHEDVDLAAWAHAYREAGGDVLAMVASGGADLYATRIAPRVALAIGNEGSGISAALAAQATQRVTIPMPGATESLNAAAAAAVCLFECVRRRRERAGGGAAG